MNREDHTNSLPLRGRTHSRVIIAHHLIFYAYGQWLPNDPRGSGSSEIREPKLEDLGEIHFGRKRIQPPRQEIRSFYRDAEPRLDFPTIWFDDAKRQAILEGFSRVVEENRYTVWGCAILRNHAHVCVRRHRDDGRSIWARFTQGARNALRGCADIPDDHPVWGNRPYAVFLYTPEDVRRVVSYIAGNPAKDGLAPQSWSFVKPYDNFPFTNKS
jgi:hypothetical protein